MDRFDQFRYDLGYPCNNPRCYAAVHATPTCPYWRPEPLPPSEPVPGARPPLPYVKPLDMRWIWLVPPAVVIFALIVLL
ncbi:hypothetical protein [Nocardia sp. SC052]|uniref:hypothetical protein n=1 Tax=Nocardia sichangensis TaxID=3385975 RepID=UPI0039A3CF61